MDSLVNLERPPQTVVRFGRGEGFCPARRHNHICEQALNWGADVILILGADQLYEPDLLCRLMRRFDQGYEVVSALVNSRGFVSWQEMRPFQKMAWRFKSTNLDQRRPYTGMEHDGDLLEVVQPNTGMQQIDFIGSGVLAFQAEHLRSLKRPWFAEIILGEGFNRRASMDCTFVWRLATEAHALVWCDTDITVRHLHVFSIDDTYSDRFDDWTRGAGQPDLSICHYRESNGAKRPQEADEVAAAHSRSNAGSAYE